VLEEMKAFIDKQLQPKINALLSLYYGDMVDDFNCIALKLSEITTLYTAALTGKISGRFCN
jgi:hypothetical protein